MALADKNITILGAGIGGLTLAIALARRGATVTVLEQAPALAEVGAGLQITPNGSVVLEALDLGPDLRAIGTVLQAVELCDYRHGTRVMELNMATPRHGNRQPYLAVHRADLVGMLAGAATGLGVDLRFGHKVTAVDPGGAQPSVTLADGTTHSTEILIGADGVRSLTRQRLDRVGPPRFTGQVAWRATIDRQRLNGRAVVPKARVFMGPGRHLVTYPLRGGQLINVVAVEERKNWVAEGWTHPEDPAHLRAVFAGWAPEVGRLLQACDTVFIWGLFAHPVANIWSQGNVGLLGDAAHPTLPFLAQGANMAIEDAWVLAEELERQATTASAFAAYRARRHRRVSRIVADSTGNTRIYHMGAPAVRAVMHMGMRLVNHLAAERFAARYDWLHGFDVTREV